MGDGDAGRSACGHHCGNRVPGACFWTVCCPHRVHPAGDGGTFCLPSCSQTPLVSVLSPIKTNSVKQHFDIVVIPVAGQT